MIPAVRGARVPHGSGLKQYRAEVTAVSRCPGSGRVVEAPRADLHADDEGRHRATPPTFDETVDLVGRGLAERLREISIALYERGPIAAERGILADEVRVRVRGRRADPDRRGADPDSSRFWPADGYRAGRVQPSFDKQFVRDWLDASGWDHEPPAPDLPAEVVERTSLKYREAYERVTASPFDHYRHLSGVTRAATPGADAPLELPDGSTRERAVRGPGSAQAGPARPPGQGGRGIAAGHGVDERERRARRPTRRAHDRGRSEEAAQAQVQEMAARLLSNPVIEEFQVLAGRAGGPLSAMSVDRRPRIGVVTFPGSLDDATRSARWRHGRGGASALWHADRDLRGVDAVILPGGFSYGDYLRCGAIARFAAIMDEVRAFAEAGGPSSGSATGSRSCATGAAAGRADPESAAPLRVSMGGRPRRDLRLAARRTWSPGRSAGAGQHGEGQFVASAGDLDRIERDGLVVFSILLARGATDEAQPQRRLERDRRAPQRGGNVVGLMPHPEHAVDPDVGATAAQPMFASLLSSTLARVSAA